MQRYRLIQRLFSQTERINVLDCYKETWIKKPKELKILEQFTKELISQNKLFIDLLTDKVLAKAKTAGLKHAPNLIIVDYIQLLRVQDSKNRKITN
jgi:hypothetical protein